MTWPTWRLVAAAAIGVEAASLLLDTPNRCGAFWLDGCGYGGGALAVAALAIAVGRRARWLGFAAALVALGNGAYSAWNIRHARLGGPWEIPGFAFEEIAAGFVAFAIGVGFTIAGRRRGKR
jgi:hypothetical protein